jgi:hypothetical protein
MRPPSTLAATLLLALVVALPAQAADPSEEIPNGVTCEQKLKRTYKLSAISKRGIPIKVSCTGAARFFVVPDFAAMTKADRKAAELFPRGAPNITTIPKGKLDAAGSVTLRPKLRPWARKVLRRFPKTKLLVGLGTKRVDGAYRSDPPDWSYTVVVR